METRPLWNDGEGGVGELRLPLEFMFPGRQHEDVLTVLMANRTGANEQE